MSYYTTYEICTQCQQPRSQNQAQYPQYTTQCTTHNYVVPPSLTYSTPYVTSRVVSSSPTLTNSDALITPPYESNNGGLYKIYCTAVVSVHV